ncbi:MAG: HEAT repeat domain-containing protein, partial [Pirellulaceae bacterium]
FYSAYSLAYLNDPGAIPVLEQLAQQQPAFRGLALIGLSVLDHFQAGEALERLLQSPEPEVRFGALHALRKRDDGKRSIHAQWIGETLEVVMVPSAIPLVTVALENAPEVTFFGDAPQLQLAQHHEINPRLLVRPDGKGQIRIVRFQPGDEDRVRLVQADLRSVLTGLQEVGASYNDMIQFLDQTKASSWVSTPIAFNPRPTLGRTYQRDGESSELLVDGEMSEGDFGGENSDTAKANDDSSDSWNWWPWSRKAESDAASETRAKAGTSSELIETPNKEETAPLLLDAGNSP